MGGMIAQKMAIEFPDRVLTLTSMMSSTGEQEYGQSTPEAQQVLFSGRPADRDGYVAAAERELVWASRRYGDAAQLRALAAASYDRAYYPAGVPRQLAAMILDGSRAEALTTLNVPTLVIHGLDDTLIDPSGGTADRRAGARQPGSSSSRTWGTTALRRCGPTSSMPSPRTPTSADPRERAGVPPHPDLEKPMTRTIDAAQAAALDEGVTWSPLLAQAAEEPRRVNRRLATRTRSLDAIPAL